MKYKIIIKEEISEADDLWEEVYSQTIAIEEKEMKRLIVEINKI